MIFPRLLLKATGLVAGAMVLVAGVCCADENATKTPDRQPVTRVSKVTFPLGPSQEVDEVKQHLARMCKEADLGINLGEVGRCIRYRLRKLDLPREADAENVYKKLYVDAERQVSSMQLEFRNLIRKSAESACADLFAELQRLTPRTATVQARSTLSDDGVTHSWIVDGFENARKIRLDVSRNIPKNGIVQLDLKPYGVAETMQIRLYWEGEMTLAAEQELKLSESVTGAINSPKVQVWVSRYCRPTMGLRVSRQWPLAAVDSKETAGVTVRLRNGQSHMAAGATVSGNFETASYIITLTAGKTVTLQTIPYRKKASRQQLIHVDGRNRQTLSPSEE